MRPLRQKFDVEMSKMRPLKQKVRQKCDPVSRNREEGERREEGGVRTNISVFWEGIPIHVQNQWFRQIWGRFGRWADRWPPVGGSQGEAWPAERQQSVWKCQIAYRVTEKELKKRTVWQKMASMQIWWWMVLQQLIHAKIIPVRTKMNLKCIPFLRKCLRPMVF